MKNVQDDRSGQQSALVELERGIDESKKVLLTLLSTKAFFSQQTLS